jgi:hypothetical protein
VYVAEMNFISPSDISRNGCGVEVSFLLLLGSNLEHFNKMKENRVEFLSAKEKMSSLLRYDDDGMVEGNHHKCSPAQT